MDFAPEACALIAFTVVIAIDACFLKSRVCVDLHMQEL